MTVLKLAIIGANGQMGRNLVRCVSKFKELQLYAAVTKGNDPALGRDAGEVAGVHTTGVELTADVNSALILADCAIDFSTTTATAQHVETAAAAETAYVIGVTGFTANEQTVINKAATQIPIVQSSNMSLGVTLLTALVEQAARILGPEFDPEIFEIHHNRKIDVPSGTTIGLGKAIACGLGLDSTTSRLAERSGITGPRLASSIGFASLRGGDIVGDHTVFFAGKGERIELTHRASDRSIYAMGALRAALWVSGRTPDLYSMRAVLGL